MLHHEIVNKIRRKKKHGDFLYPYYDGYNISDVIPLIYHSFGISSQDSSGLTKKRFGKYKKVILLVIDGLGYKQFVRYYRRFSFFEKLVRKGDVYPITSVFPSTTPAALTTLHTGLTPQEHGLPEWNVYFEEFDSIIETLPFKTWDMTEPDSLLSIGGSSEMLYRGETVYQTLSDNGVSPYVFVHKNYGHTAYSKSVHKGSTIIPFTDGFDLVTTLTKTLLKEDRQSYFFVYWNMIDAIGHKFGPDSGEHLASISAFSDLLTEKFFKELPKDAAQDTLFLLTADHGQVNIRGDDIINLNKYDIINDNFFISSKGKRILPTGSPHDVFLFIYPPAIPKIISFLEQELIGQAEVISIEEAVDRKLFGKNHPTNKFLRRIGNVLVLPYDGFHIWYEFLPGSPYTQLGIHGGLSEDEMLVPLGVSDLRNLL